VALTQTEAGTRILSCISAGVRLREWQHWQTREAPACTTEHDDAKPDNEQRAQVETPYDFPKHALIPPLKRPQSENGRTFTGCGQRTSNQE
jgi:hypothetical protein